MNENKVRQPRQVRSIDKKNKIIETAYEVFSQVGYYNANTTDIAKKAGVSTGIVYGYFKDKRDILLYVIEIYINKVSMPVMEYMKGLTAPINYNDFIEGLVDLVIATHKSNSNLHNILHSLAVTDRDINARFLKLEDHITHSASEQLKGLGVDVPHLEEKVHIAMNSIQFFAHEYVYDKHEYIDYDEMKKYVCKMIVLLFTE